MSAFLSGVDTSNPVWLAALLLPPLFWIEVGRKCTCGDKAPLNEEVCR